MSTNPFDGEIFVVYVGCYERPLNNDYRNHRDHVPVSAYRPTLVQGRKFSVLGINPRNPGEMRIYACMELATPLVYMASLVGTGWGE